jgi:hypothetical protein
VCIGPKTEPLQGGDRVAKCERAGRSGERRVHDPLIPRVDAARDLNLRSRPPLADGQCKGILRNRYVDVVPASIVL